MIAPRVHARFALTLAAALFCVVPIHAQKATSFRTISGIVTDTSHEPLRGAAVELRDPASNALISRLTDTTGHYTFKRIDSNTDYTLRAVYRGHESRLHTISKFDSHLEKVIDFTIKPY